MLFVFLSFFFFFQRIFIGIRTFCFRLLPPCTSYSCYLPVQSVCLCSGHVHFISLVLFFIICFSAGFHFDQNLLSELSLLGFSPATVISSVRNNQHDAAYAAYFLLEASKKEALIAATRLMSLTDRQTDRQTDTALLGKTDWERRKDLCKFHR